jgi:glycosyltransferase involved in cell wall biosynthesis
MAPTEHSELRASTDLFEQIADVPLRVLHVTACFAGGVSRAIFAIVDLAPERSHFLLGAGADMSSEDTLRFQETRTMPEGIVARVRAVARMVEDLQIDVVHAHSSWAGFLTRIRSLPVPVVYQPHCYAFEMAGFARKVAYFAAEVALAPRASAVAVLSPRERTLAARVSPRARQVLLPNVPTVSSRDRSGVEESGAGSVVMVGRLCDQKDPLYFLRVCCEARLLNPNVSFVWVGDGDSNMRDQLVRGGVRVTGWLDPGSVAKELDAAALYIHTARYEGFPLSVLDAAARDLPILVRKISAFDGTSLLQMGTPSEMARTVTRVALEPEFARAIRLTSRDLLTDMNPAAQSVALKRLYEPFDTKRQLSGRKR